MSATLTRRWHQLAAIISVETRRTIFSMRTLPVYILACLPIGVAAAGALIALAFGPAEGGTGPDVQAIFGATFGLIVRLPLYFGCVWLFVNMVRGEMIDRSLHYYFLAPIRREMIVAGKFASGVLVTSVVFCSSTVLTFLLIHVPLGLSLTTSELFAGGGILQLLKYVAIIALGCVGYGGLFLAVGLFFKNPIIPALAIWTWESIGYLLPPSLQKISVLHHLSAIKPIEIGQGGLIVVIADPPSIVSSVIGILCVALVLLAAASWRARRIEIDYAAE